MKRVREKRSRAPKPRPARAEQQLPLLLVVERAPRVARAPYVFSALSPAEPTVVFDTYWRFAAERQAIFFRRLRGVPPPWTDDPVLREFKFTNAYRAADRVSQFLLRDVVYAGPQDPEEVFFRTLLFKFFNKIETWQLLVERLGAPSFRTYAFERYDEVLSEALDRGQSIYSAAYIMPSGPGLDRRTRKHRVHLRLLERMMADELALRLRDARSMAVGFDLLRSYPTIGDFLAYQYITDLNYGPLLNLSEMEFVVPGPGARSGLRKCFHTFGGLGEVDMIKVVTDRQEREFERLGIRFESLWGRPLQLIDCQNLFCEVDKYARVHHPDVVGLSRRARIKQRFRPTGTPVSYWFPPKWGLNELIHVPIPERGRRP